MGGDTTDGGHARGPIATSAMGKTLMHEHVFIISPEIAAELPRGLGRRGRPGCRRRAPPERAEGVGHRHHRRPDRARPRPLHPAHRRASPSSIELNIVVATGLYTFNDVPHYFGSRVPGTGPDGSDPMVDMFVRDITRGHRRHRRQGRHHQVRHRRPGVTPGVERVLRACAKAHRATGVPITTHTHAALPPRPRAAADLRRGGRRPVARRDRPLRRHRRPRLPRGDHRQRQHPRHGPLRHRRLPADRPTG